jgi:hypothetical protein
MKFVQDVILNAATDASVESEIVELNQIYGYAMQCEFIGSPSGTLKLQASCQQLTNGQQAPTVWNDVSNSTVNVSASGTVLYNYDAQYYRYVKVVYTRLSGTGSLKVTYNGKG